LKTGRIPGRLPGKGELLIEAQDRKRVFATALAGKDSLAVDIASYAAGAVACQAAAARVFTYATPRLPIFTDSRTGEYGAPWR